jgi:hypothetical protein
MNEKSDVTEEHNGSLAQRYRCYVAQEMNTAIPPVKYCPTYAIRHSEVELLSCSCNCTTACQEDAVPQHGLSARRCTTTRPVSKTLYHNTLMYQWSPSMRSYATTIRLLFELTNSERQLWYSKVPQIQTTWRGSGPNTGLPIWIIFCPCYCKPTGKHNMLCGSAQRRQSTLNWFCFLNRAFR